MGSFSGRAAPHSHVDVRCEAIASPPAAKTAASIRISRVVAAPYILATSRCWRSTWVFLIASFHCCRVSPESRNVMSPRCIRAYRSLCRKSMPMVGHRALRTGRSRRSGRHTHSFSCDDAGAWHPDRKWDAGLGRAGPELARDWFQGLLGQRWQRGQKWVDRPPETMRMMLARPQVRQRWPARS